MSGRNPEAYAALEAELAASRAELACQTAVSGESQARLEAVTDILRVISASPTDVQPVFDAITERAMALCGARFGGTTRFDGKALQFMSQRGLSSALVEATRAAFPIPVDRREINAQAVRERQPVQIDFAAIVADPDYDPALRRVTHESWFNLGSGLAVPMLRGEDALGTIMVARAESGLFPEPLVKLLQAFADLAVIAIENVRLFNETREALEQQTATAEVLRVISSSVADAQPVFEKILDSCQALFGVDQMAITLVHDDGQVHAGAWRGEVMQESVKLLPTPVEKSATGQAILARRAVHIPDVAGPAATINPVMRAVRERLGNFSALFAPLLLGGRGIGAIALFRMPRKPFSEKEIVLLTSFAEQAVIALENVRLFRETREALERQTATAEILQVISESPTDVQPVFDAIAERAMALCGAQIGTVQIFDGDEVRVGTVKGWLPQADLAAFQAVFPMRPSRATIGGRAILNRAPVQVSDVLADPDYFSVGKIFARADRARSGLAVPLLRERECIGAITVHRPVVGTFPDNIVTLLQTFAAQAVIAIENVRLFNETREALDQQTAISDILRVTTASPTDVQPVLDAIADHAVRLCDAASASLFLVMGDKLRHVSSRGPYAEQVASGDVLPIDRSSISGRAILDRDVVHVTDMQSEAVEFPLGYEYACRMGHRSIVVAPLFREGEPFGTIMLRRMEVRGFSEREIALLRTFGDQAAIALENVRLFNETKDALEQQTATSEVLRVISGSIADTQPVFEKILDSCARLFDAENMMILLARDEQFHLAAVRGRLYETFVSIFPTPITDSVGAIALTERRVVHDPSAARIEHPSPNSKKLYEMVGDYSRAMAPMLLAGRGIGTIAVLRHPPRPFTDKELALLSTFADQAVIAIENARLFREIEDKSRQLADANQHKSDFLATMSHELRTPLNAIIGFSEVLLERMFGELNDKQDDYLKDILSSGRHLLSLITDILDLSKIEAGRMELELEEFDVAAALGSTLTLIRERAQQHGVELSLEVDPALGEICADQRKLKQVMLNLLSNAVKFTPDGGHISVRAALAGEMLEVAVTDTGIGIAAEDCDTVFQEFRQVGGNYANKQEGTGLGLALTRRFVELHGGSISLQSTPGQGSTFTFTIPRQL